MSLSMFRIFYMSNRIGGDVRTHTLIYTWNVLFLTLCSALLAVIYCDFVHSEKETLHEFFGGRKKLKSKFSGTYVLPKQYSQIHTDD